MYEELKISDGLVDVGTITKRAYGRCGKGFNEARFKTKIADKARSARTKWGGVYLDFFLQETDVLAQIPNVGNKKADRDADQRYILDWILNTLGEQHPFITSESIGFEKEQTAAVPVERSAYYLDGTLSKHVTYNYNQLGLRRFITTNRIGRAKATTKLTEWVEDESFKFVEDTYSASAIVADAMIADMPGGIGDCYLYDGLVYASHLKEHIEAIGKYASSKKVTEGNGNKIKVRLSFHPGDPLTFGHWWFDNNACFQLRSQSSTAPIPLAQDPDTVSIFVYDVADRVIGRAWGRLLTEEGTRKITSLIVTNVYPNSSSKNIELVRAAILALVDKLGMQEAADPTLTKTETEGAWVYFNRDAKMYSTEGSNDPYHWSIDNAGCSKTWLERDNEDNVFCPVWSGDLVPIEAKYNLYKVDHKYYEYINRLGIALDLDAEGKPCPISITAWSDGLALGLVSPTDPCPPNYLPSLSEQDRATLVDILITGHYGYVSTQAKKDLVTRIMNPSVRIHVSELNVKPLLSYIADYKNRKKEQTKTVDGTNKAYYKEPATSDIPF